MTLKTAKTAVVTGGHEYDVVKLHLLFRGLDGIDAYIQHMDDFASSPEEVRDSYDAVVFYTMLMEGPHEEGLPGYAGKPKAAVEHLGATSQGIIMLHHAILAYPQCETWSDIVGITKRSFGFHIGQSIHVQVSDSDHPVTAGLKEWDMIDETYTMSEPGSDSHPLLTVDHPKSMRTIAWTRQYRMSRVLCLQSGHDDGTWRNARFREVLRRGILWCSGRL